MKNYDEIAKQMNFDDYKPKNGEITTKTSLERLMRCDHVYEAIPVFQQGVCTKGYKWIDLIQCYLVIIIFAYLISVTMERFANYVQKKLDEKKVIGFFFFFFCFFAFFLLFVFCLNFLFFFF